MKIAVISDVHLGYGAGTELEGDAFEAFQEALERCLDCDAILLAGDIFDTKNPTNETLAKAMELLLKPKLKTNQTKVTGGVNKDMNSLSPLNLSGIPVIAIHGTHERRVKGFLNPVQVLEKAGLLLYIHCNGIVLEKGAEKVCVQGFGGVPDQYADSLVREWGPKPVPGCRNIFMFHQTLSGFIPAPQTMSREVLPDGFDLFVCGHFHEPGRTDINGTPLLIPGSLVRTQLKDPGKLGFWLLDTSNIKMDFQELVNQRVFYSLEFTSPEKETVREEIEKILSRPHDRKPIIRIRLQGKITRDFTKELQSAFGERTVLVFKKELGEEKLASRGLEEQRLSVQELGRKLLRQNLVQAGLNPKTFETVFELLEEKKPDAALELLRERHKK